MVLRLVGERVPYGDVYLIWVEVFWFFSRESNATAAKKSSKQKLSAGVVVMMARLDDFTEFVDLGNLDG